MATKGLTAALDVYAQTGQVPIYMLPWVREIYWHTDAQQKKIISLENIYVLCEEMQFCNLDLAWRFYNFGFTRFFPFWWHPSSGKALTNDQAKLSPGFRTELHLGLGLGFAWDSRQV